MRYDVPADEDSRTLQEMLRVDGPGRVLIDICGMEPDEQCYRLCLDEWAAIPPQGGRR
jgi:hypothetical protein